MNNRIVSKRTKLLFIAFGAASIALLFVVFEADFNAMLNPKTASAVPALHQAAK